MANSLLTTSKIVREATILFMNSNKLIQSVNRQHDKDFGKAGDKIGSQLRIRLPNDYVPTDGPALSLQDTASVQTVLTVATQSHIDLGFTSADLFLSLDDFAENFVEPAMNVLAGRVANYTALATDVGFIPPSVGMPAAPLIANTGGICNAVANVDVSNNLLNPTRTQILQAKAYLEDMSAPMGNRKIVWDQWTEARIVDSLAGLFNPTPKISKQYEDGSMKQALGFDHFMDQTVIKHTNGSFTAGTVNGAGQTGNTIAVNAITGSLNVGDIITIAGVFSVNRVTKQTTGNLRQFAVTALAPSGSTTISIYPNIVAPAVAGTIVQYQSVTASAANGAAITLFLKPNVIYRKNIAYAPEAITLATGNLPLPPNTDAARAEYDGISLRMVNQYLAGTDQEVHRIDVLYGALVVRPEWGVVIADAV